MGNAAANAEQVNTNAVRKGGKTRSETRSGKEKVEMALETGRHGGRAGPPEAKPARPAAGRIEPGERA